jgi:hypothetical protein
MQSVLQAVGQAETAPDVLMLQSEMENPLVEALMACPLSTFIHFAVNNCGYKATADTSSLLTGCIRCF